MENQPNLENWQTTAIGTKEATKLKPCEVKIISLEKVSVAGKKAGTTYEKVVFEVEHPDSKKPIHISDVEFIDGKKIERKATWYMLDTDGLLQKNSGLAAILRHYRTQNLQDMISKKIMTTTDDRGYLCLKAY